MAYDDGEGGQVSLWNDDEGFYFDAITWGPGSAKQLPIRSLVGLIPLFATLTLEPEVMSKFPGFKKRMEWFIENRSMVSKRNIANMSGTSSLWYRGSELTRPVLSVGGKADRRLLALANEDRLRRILERMLDETEFLSEHGIRSCVAHPIPRSLAYPVSYRSLSRYHKENPWSMEVNGEEFSVHYWPADSRSGMFGGNSNWRGPIWLATTFLLIESLQRFYQYHGSAFTMCVFLRGVWRSLR